MFKLGGSKEGVGKGEGVKLGAVPAKIHPAAVEMVGAVPLIGVVRYQISTFEELEKVHDSCFILTAWLWVCTLNVMALEPLLLVYGGTVDSVNVCAFSPAVKRKAEKNKTK